MTHVVKMQNLASGDILVFENSFIQNYSFKKNLNWDVTNTIGRMDPIKTFKNTESKVEVSFTVINPHSNVVLYSLEDATEDEQKQNRMNRLFEDTSKTMFVRRGIYSYERNINVISKVLYPSYADTGNNVQIQSAPVLRVRIYKKNKKQNIIFDGFATINVLDTNLRAEDVSSPGGRNFSSVEFSILFDVIHNLEEDVAAYISEEVPTITAEAVLQPSLTPANNFVEISPRNWVMQNEENFVETEGANLFAYEGPLRPED